MVVSSNPAKLLAFQVTMTENSPDILLVDHGRIDPAELARLVRLFFGDMVKYVVDIESRSAAVGGELHADAEQITFALIGRGEPIE